MDKRKQHILKITAVFIFLLTIISCTPENECETETVCYGEGNCIEKPISGTCID